MLNCPYSQGEMCGLVAKIPGQPACHVTADDCRDCLAESDGQPSLSRPTLTIKRLLAATRPAQPKPLLECVHRGQPVRMTVCDLCGGTKGQPLQVLACDLHGECSLHRQHSKVKACAACDDRRAADTAPKLIRPWERHSVTICIPHYETPELLPLAVRAWRTQTTRPFLLIIDTGSTSAASHKALDAFAEAPDVEVARLGIKTDLQHRCDGITAAMDYALSRCPTPLLFHTHTDLFPKRRELLADMAEKCNSETPVVGWEMSPRGGPKRDLSAGIPGHVCLMLHVASLDRLGAGWSIRRAANVYGLARTNTEIAGWPDTEVLFGMLLKDASIEPTFLGRETNGVNQETEDWLHVRSYTGYAADGRKLPRHIDGMKRAIEIVESLERAK